tara:strand:+ start:2955 stop:4664 length:1710 start_codon:yes stop_codon:yes gene_type:complete
MVATRNITDLNVLVTPDVDDVMLIVEKLSATSTEAKQITWGNLQEALQDIVGALVNSTTTIDFTYDDVNGTLSALVVPNTTVQKSIYKDGTTTSTRQEAQFIDGPGVDVVVTDDSTYDCAKITVSNTGIVTSTTNAVSGTSYSFLSNVAVQGDGTKELKFKPFKLGSPRLTVASTDSGDSLTLDIDTSAININDLDSTNPLTVALGGTGASAANIARNNLGAAKNGANSDISSLSGLTTALSVSQGGTGDSTASGALKNLFGLNSCVGVGASGEQVVFQTSSLVAGSFRAEFKGIKPTGDNYITVVTDGSDIALGANPNNVFDGISGVRNANGARITNAGAPVNSGDLVTKGYLDAQTTGLDIKESVRAAATGNIAGTYSNGAQTLTANSNGAAVIDGETLNLGDRVLIHLQTTGTQKGIYTVTTLGDASNPFVLTRADDFNQSSEIGAGSFTYVEAGTANNGKSFVQTVRNPILDTTDLVFSVFGETAIGTNSIANSKLQQIPQATIKGRAAAAGTGDVSDLTADQLIAVINAGTAATIDLARLSIQTPNQLVAALNQATDAVDAGTY